MVAPTKRNISALTLILHGIINILEHVAYSVHKQRDFTKT